MDRAPSFETPGQETEEERRKRRFLEKLQSWTHEAEEPVPEQPEEATHLSELWTRGDKAAEVGVETELPLELTAFELPAIAPRIQQLGREVLSQSQSVGEFTEAVQSEVDALPQETQAELEPEITRLDNGAAELDGATEVLEDELVELDEALNEPDDAPLGAESVDTSLLSPVESVASPLMVAERARKEANGISGMARLVIATLIGGGLGALIGTGSEKRRSYKLAKEKSAMAKDKEKTDKIIERHETKLAAQEVQLQQLKAKQAESAGAPPQKEYIQKAGELAERQADLTQDAAEQVRAVAHQVEADRTFRIPEQRAAQQERAAQHRPDTLRPNDSSEHLERLKGSPSEKRDKGETRSDEQQQDQTVGVERLPYTPKIQHSSIPEWRQLAQPRKQATQTWLYVVLLVIAVTVTLGLLIFGSK